jgi:hypothetical protein
VGDVAWTTLRCSRGSPVQGSRISSRRSRPSESPTSPCAVPATVSAVTSTWRPSPGESASAKSSARGALGPPPMGTSTRSMAATEPCRAPGGDAVSAAIRTIAVSQGAYWTKVSRLRPTRYRPELCLPRSGTVSQAGRWPEGATCRTVTRPPPEPAASAQLKVIKGANWLSAPTAATMCRSPWPSPPVSDSPGPCIVAATESLLDKASSERPVPSPSWVWGAGSRRSGCVCAAVATE